MWVVSFWAMNEMTISDKVNIPGGVGRGRHTDAVMPSSLGNQNL